MEVTTDVTGWRHLQHSPQAGTRRRVCLLTGAAGRLGTAFIEKFAGTCNVAAVYHETELAQASQELRFFDPLNPQNEHPDNRRSVYAIKADITKDADLERVVEIALARFGVIDLIVNAAADVRFHGSLLDITELENRFSAQLQTNVFAPVKLTALVTRKFWARNIRENLRDRRNVINISSISAHRVFPNVGQAFYGGSKATINYLTVHLAAELKAYNIRVNALSPARFPDGIPTESVVEAIARIDASGVNGKVIVLDERGEQQVALPT